MTGRKVLLIVLEGDAVDSGKRRRSRAQSQKSLCWEPCSPVAGHVACMRQRQ